MKDSNLLQFHIFIAAFKLLSCELDNFTFNVFYSVISYIIEKIKLEYFYRSL